MMKQSAEIRPNVTIDESLEMEMTQETNNLQENIRLIKEELVLSSLVCDNQLRKEYLHYLNDNDTLIGHFNELDNEIQTLQKNIMDKIIEMKSLLQEKSDQLAVNKDKITKLQTIFEYTGEDRSEFIRKLISNQ